METYSNEIHEAEKSDIDFPRRFRKLNLISHWYNDFSEALKSKEGKIILFSDSHYHSDGVYDSGVYKGSIDNDYLVDIIGEGNLTSTNRFKIDDLAGLLVPTDELTIPATGIGRFISPHPSKYGTNDLDKIVQAQDGRIMLYSGRSLTSDGIYDSGIVRIDPTNINSFYAHVLDDSGINHEEQVELSDLGGIMFLESGTNLPTNLYRKVY